MRIWKKVIPFLEYFKLIFIVIILIKGVFLNKLQLLINFVFLFKTSKYNNKKNIYNYNIIKW